MFIISSCIIVYIFSRIIPVPGSLKEININLSKILKCENISVIPGQTMCPTCRIECSSVLSNAAVVDDGVDIESDGSIELDF